MLQVRLFGTFELRAGALPVTLTSSRAQSLLALLALRPGVPQRRDRVAFLLWPSSTEPQARTNLRHVLHNLRAAVPGIDQHLRATSRTLALAGVAADVAASVDNLRGAEVVTADGELVLRFLRDWAPTVPDELGVGIVAFRAPLMPALPAERYGTPVLELLPVWCRWSTGG